MDQTSTAGVGDVPLPEITREVVNVLRLVGEVTTVHVEHFGVDEVGVLRR